jgi:hypothetical protein
MLNLMLHCGAQSVGRGQIELSKTPRPTETWTPVPHVRLLQQVEHTLRGSGLRIINEAHALSNDGMRYFGLLEVVNGHSSTDYNLVLGIRNSHDKSFPAALAVGSGVFVCDNLAFSGEVTIARRHTTFIERDLPQLVERAIGRLGDLRAFQDRRIDAYKHQELPDTQAHDVLVRAVDARVLPVTALPDALVEWRYPKHPEFEAAGKTAWRLFNAVTEAIKGRSLDVLPRRTQALHGLMDAACGLPQMTQN